ncbi:MAG: 50S ribosomal protein L20 [Candidatus Omnitrophica bacterium]|nr:50S ribosomal protein L20 [Candidatus Omnitrophota bacterium]
MPRATNNPASRRRRKKVLKSAKGFFQGRRKLYRQAKETVIRGLAFAFRDRKARKREFRNLWTIRINAACRENGISYSRFISGLKKEKVALDRKALAELAVRDSKAFTKLVELVKTPSK